MSVDLVLLLSGKRKCGKDYISEQLLKTLGDDIATIVRISAPIKDYYAKVNNLNFEELMSDNKYKESYRIAMINWSDEVRAKDPGYFCKLACDSAVKKRFWIVSDVRRKTDVKWFQGQYGDKIKTVRIESDLDVRKERGWNFTIGVDDVTSECDLDDFDNWTLQITNNNEDTFKKGFNEVLMLISTIT